MAELAPERLFQGRRIALVGKFAGMSKREAQQLVRGHGATVVERLEPSLDVVVVGEQELPLADGLLEESLDETLRRAIDNGTVEVISETQLWQRLGFVEQEQNIHRLYTPAMLADLLAVPVSVIRRWHRRGLIVPAREVRKLPYFDFREVATARRLAELLAAGATPGAIEKKLAELGRFLPGVERPLAQLSVIVEGKQLLLRQGNGLVEPGGQFRFDFGQVDQSSAPAAEPHADDEVLPFNVFQRPAAAATSEQMSQMAGDLEDEGHLEAAAEMYRAVMAASGPTPELCFLVAELLYQTGELEAARERYYMAIELDEDYVEARANLGCVLAELGTLELAEAAFQGALAYHSDYPDAHYHLARVLDEQERGEEAESHWRTFVCLAPDSPWADEARERLEQGGAQKP